MADVGDILIKAGRVLKALRTIFIAIFVIILLVFIARSGYPRITLGGHTESGFDTFMQTYVHSFVVYIRDLAPHAVIDEETQMPPPLKLPTVGAFVDAYKAQFHIDLLAVDTSSITINNPDFTPLFMYFIFYHDIKKGKTSNLKNAYDILKGKLKHTGIEFVQSLYDLVNYTTYHALLPTTIEKFVALHATFQALCNDVYSRKAATEALIATGNPPHLTKQDVDVFVLNLMTNIYVDGKAYLAGGDGYTNHRYPNLEYHDTIDNIDRMNRTRFTGGGVGGNWAIIGLYIEDYFNYIVFDKIVNEIWKHYPVDAKRWWKNVVDAITSPAIAEWIAHLPSNMAGEGYKNKAAAIIVSTADQSGVNADGDIVEHFFGLDKIIMAFISLVKVLIGVVSVMTDPLAFIKFIIGAILAICLEIVYILICIIADIIIGPILGYVGRLFYNIYLTVFLFVTLLIYVVFYGVLGVIDIFTGGLIMRMMRCENLPDAWATTSNWGRNNRYTRTFLCGRSCWKRYYPSGLMCIKQAVDEPTFAPQQVLYQTWQNGNFVTSTRDKIAYSHRPSAKYFVNMTESAKKEMWQDVYTQQVDFYGECREQFKVYDTTACAMCLYYTDPKNTTGLTDAAIAKIKSLCVATYCTTNDSNLNNLSFCKEAEKNLDLIEPPDENRDIVLKIILALICIAVAFVIVALLMNADNVFYADMPGYDLVLYDKGAQWPVIRTKPGMFNSIKENLGKMKDQAISSIKEKFSKPVGRK